MVNLNECSPGDYLITRNGCLYIYERRSNYALSQYRHIVSYPRADVNCSLNDVGQIYCDSTSGYDVIETITQTNSNTPYFELYEKLRLYKRTSSTAQGSNQCVF
jgi:hypothetical protein